MSLLQNAFDFLETRVFQVSVVPQDETGRTYRRIRLGLRGPLAPRKPRLLHELDSFFGLSLASPAISSHWGGLVRQVEGG